MVRVYRCENISRLGEQGRRNRCRRLEELGNMGEKERGWVDFRGRIGLN